MGSELARLVGAVVCLSVSITIGVQTKLRPFGLYYLWVVCSFGYQALILFLTSIDEIQDDSGSFFIRFVPMIVVGLAISIVGSLSGLLSPVGLLLFAPIAITFGYFLESSISLLAVASVLIFLPTIFIGRDVRLDELLMGARASAVMFFGLGALVFASNARSLGACREDKCSIMGLQVGTTGSANALGVAVAILVVLAVIGFSFTSTIVVLLPAGLMIDLTSSRSGLTIFLLGSVLVLLLNSSVSFRHRCLVGVVSAIGSLVVLFALWPWSPSDFTGRPILWAYVRARLADSPLIGFGPSSWTRLSSTSDFSANYSSHNVLTEVLYSYGFIGAGLLLAGVFWTVSRTNNSAKTLQWFLMGLWLASGITEVSSLPGRVYLLPGLLVFAAFAHQSDASKSQYVGRLVGSFSRPSDRAKVNS